MTLFHLTGRLERRRFATPRPHGKVSSIAPATVRVPPGPAPVGCLNPSLATTILPAMADRLQEDATVLNADAHAYTRLLAPAAPGYALWQPTDVEVSGKLGDCGQITDGRFYKYFNILSEGTGYPRFEGASTQDVPPPAPEMKSQSDIGLSMGGHEASSRKTASIEAHKTWTNNEFAFLQLIGKCASSEFTPETKDRIQDYLIQNDSEIRNRLGDVPGTIVILTRVVHAQSWVGAVARKEAPARKRWFGLPVKLPGQPSAQSRDPATTESRSEKLPLDNFGSYTRGPAVPSSRTYCVIVGTMQSLKRTKRVNAKGPAPWRKALNMSAPAVEGEVAVYASTTADPLSEMMRMCLDAWEKYSVDLVVSRWDIITDFYKAHPDSPIASIGVNRTSDNKLVIFVRLSPPDPDTETRAP